MNKKILLLFSIALLLIIQISPASALETITIKSDGNIDPPTSAIQSTGNVYIFTDDITAAIVVEKSGIIIDGDGYTLSGVADNMGISLRNINNTIIQNIEIVDSNTAISLLSSSNNNTITGNIIIYNTEIGIFLNSANNNNIINNTIVYNGADAIEIHHSSYNTITGNLLMGNSGQGVRLYNSSDNNITANNITDNEANGIYLHSSSINNKIIANNITLNIEYGISLDFDSENNIIYHNNLFDNGNPATSYAGGTNTWDNGYPSGGNYWSDYNGIDSNGDGIGDTPYVIDENNKDNYPLVNKFIIPEFPSYIILFLFMIITLFLIAIKKNV